MQKVQKMAQINRTINCTKRSTALCYVFCICRNKEGLFKRFCSIGIVGCKIRTIIFQFITRRTIITNHVIFTS